MINCLLNRIKRKLFSIIIFFLIITLFFACKEEKKVIVPQIPEIIGLSTDQVFIGDSLTIYGKDFGLPSENSGLILEKDGFNQKTDTLITINSDFCFKWTYSKIQFKVPNDFVSGFLGVSANDITSNKIHIKVDKLPNLETVEIPSGSFNMGSNNGWNNEQPIHKIFISRAMYMSKYEINQYLWTKVMDSNPSIYKGEDLPVHNVSWYNAIKFCNKISKKLNFDTCYVFVNDSLVIWNRNADGYRLPTEAEWEYACRAGSNQDFPFAKNPDIVAWYSDNSAYTPHPSGLKKANGFGLYDMQGNVWEWCWDWFDNTFYRYSPARDPIGPGIGIKRVLRGGSVNNGKAFIRATNRTYPDNNFKFCGLRIVRTKFD